MWLESRCEATKAWQRGFRDRDSKQNGRISDPAVRKFQIAETLVATRFVNVTVTVAISAVATTFL